MGKEKRIRDRQQEKKYAKTNLAKIVSKYEPLVRVLMKILVSTCISCGAICATSLLVI